MLITINLYVLADRYYLADVEMEKEITKFYGVKLLNINDYFLNENSVIYNIVDNFGIIRLFTLMYIQLSNINDNKLTLTFY